MSRFIKTAIAIPAGVEVAIEGERVRMKGPSGEVARDFPDSRVTVSRQGDGELMVSRKNPEDDGGAIAGTYWRLLSGMVTGVKDGVEKVLELVGVGYRAQLSGNELVLQLGFSHPVKYTLPAGVTATLPSQTEIVLKGADKVLVGQAATDIRAYRPPEPYKGKGVRYRGEAVVIKETKKK